jgi:hypothetical protein
MAIGKFFFGPVLGISVAIGAYLCLSFVNATEAKFFAIVVGAALCIASWASPGMDIRTGLKRLWLFDWIVAAIPSVTVLLINSQDTVGARVVRSIMVLIFTLSGFVCIRRPIRGKK